MIRINLTLYTLINPRRVWLVAKQLETWRFLGDPFEGEPFAKAAIIPCLHKAFENYHETVNMRSTVPSDEVAVAHEAIGEAAEIALEREREARRSAQALWEKMEADRVGAGLELLTEYLSEWDRRDEYPDVVEAYEQRISDWTVVFRFIKEYGTAHGMFTLNEEKEKQIAKFFQSPCPHNFFLIDYQNMGAPLSTSSVGRSITKGTNIDSVNEAATSEVPKEETARVSTAVSEASRGSFVPNIGKKSLRSARITQASVDDSGQAKNKSTPSEPSEVSFVPNIGKKSLRSARFTHASVDN